MDFNEIKFLRNLGAKIKKYRIQKNYSAGQLADLCHIDKTTMLKIENGKFDMLVDTLFCISNFLATPVDDFLVL